MKLDSILLNSCVFQVVDKVLEKYPDRDILITGHSLGCALTGMMAVEYETQNVVGVCFSSTGAVWSHKIVFFCFFGVHIILCALCFCRNSYIYF